MAAKDSTRHMDAELLDLVVDVISAGLTSWPHERVGRFLVDSFEVASTGHYFRSSQGLEQRTWPPEFFRPFAGEVEHWTRTGADREHPILRYYLATGDARAIQIDDVPSRFAGRRVMGRWRELGRVWGDVSSQIAIPVHFGPTEHRAFLVGRADTFTEREVALAARTQRVLTVLDRQIATYADWASRCGADAVGIAKAVLLTPRELAVLDLLARGMTAGSIGRRLCIAERTVQKHLQHCYRKLGVSDRLTAVQTATAIGLLRSVRPGSTYFPPYPDQHKPESNGTAPR